MINLPAPIDRKLKALFPKAADRNRFVADLVAGALDREEGTEDIAVGGTLHLFTDGGSRGNPGHAAIGIVLEDPVRGEVLEERGECIGIGTNNVAEYRALIGGLKIARRRHPNRLVCHLDSELIVKQMSGEYRVKMPTLQPLFGEIRELSLSFPSIAFVHIPRADNHRADALVNRALDAHPAPRYERL